ncbi:MAG TPA: alpha/beta hydrolase [Acidimicrobiales bacterium]|nr:alpha/beta hydrolase [Acidimicrobiales bacterium]MDP6213999.1 alpha/beta hydrolase [Acidimicrobiales bacterium]MDP7208418.1 alpha/beta hydrolase [Acidimicrobiales bacterium]HJL89633.1 alpha/beta hydrolase [Acidimicrobiales bacterium]HJO99668.1 alpha/beta hydrolase [Acidimicrobiales bacterium]
MWWKAGSADVLVLQPADDVVALPANADDIVERLGERATLVAAADAGHALLPEQPEAVADALLSWLRGHGR